MLRNVLIIPVVKGKIKVKLAPAISTGAPTTITEEIIQTLPLIALKTIKTLSKAETYLLNFLLHDFFE